MSAKDILGVLQSVLVLLSKLCPDFLPTLKDLLEKLSGESGQMWWAELKRFVCKKPCWLPNILRVDHSKSFDPVAFLGQGWSIWKGPKDGSGLEGEEEQDNGSLALTEIDLTRVRLESMLEEGEPSVPGEEKLERLKAAKHIRLDAKVFLTLWENLNLIPESWKEKTSGTTTFIYFDGTVLRDSDGCRYVLVLYWCGDRWDWGRDRLDRNRRPYRLSAVLAA